MALSPWTSGSDWPRTAGFGGVPAGRGWDIGFPTATDLFHDLERLVDLPTGMDFSKDLAPLGMTTVDVKETPTHHIFHVDVPGFSKNEVTVSVQGRNLTVSGERKREDLKEGETWRRTERQFGRFVRTFRVPPNADLEQITAAAENGVLEVKVAKKQEEKPAPETRQIKIE